MDQRWKGMKLGCINAKGWEVGKLEDIGCELNSGSLDSVGLTEAIKENKSKKAMSVCCERGVKRDGCMKIGCLNVRGWGIGKLDDLSRELNEWNLDIVGLTETHLRDRVLEEGFDYVMVCKGRCKQERMGGGVALLYRKERNFVFEEVDIGNSAMSEDILVMKVECMDTERKKVKMIIAVAYMTVESERGRRENVDKYKIMKNIIREYNGENVIVMGDMNGHIGLLGERINQNGEMLIEFTDEMGLENLNETLAKGRVTWCVRGQESAIDYMIVNGKMREIVNSMWIDEDGWIDIVSDHNMLVAECRLYGRAEKKVKVEKRKWKLRNAN